MLFLRKLERPRRVDYCGDLKILLKTSYLEKHYKIVVGRRDAFLKFKDVIDCESKTKM